jgi:hypothetical protein
MRAKDLTQVAAFAAMALMASPAEKPRREDLAPKQPSREPPARPHWSGDGAAPEGETRQQRRARERRGASR